MIPECQTVLLRATPTQQNEEILSKALDKLTQMFTLAK